MELFPPIPLADWAPTKHTLHRFLQVVGKIRLESSPRRNHWWHVPFHLTGNGLTTRPMGQIDGNPVFTVDFDLVGHRLLARVLDGREASFSLPGHSVATFHQEVLTTLMGLGVHARIPHPYPYDLPDAERPFADDTEHADYDPAAVTRYWRVLSQVGLLLEEFAGRYSGKTSPVHHFWHTLDIATTRFSNTPVRLPEEAGPLIREAYSREAVSFGFWFGDDSVPEPAFYSYTAPEPPGLADEPLPEGAEWLATAPDRHLALLRYDRARTAPDPRAAVLDFYEAAYRAGARGLGWDIAETACPDGVTDPYRAP
ncbi:DUF5996 family protein [Streptomonospora nanhaiensis]|uniref:Ava_C0101 and related proteins n=1 Tax=Streptomonospora nanhaiensis TaxID=1323731 RepID=A0A853BRA9_9ACTN|nr:DUF5996 family protein [Streptomonospora nanhaiensis]MBX9390964.1 hypothetical protein [Streptomonospora nanhaiensis]NYI97394.1 hypothetical protein [Streptomonospora nanhaiensis]